MSAVNVFVFADAAVVMTDGLAAEADGSNPRLVQKVLPLAHLNAVVATRGPAYLLAGITDMLARHASFDDARVAMADDMRALVQGLRARLPNAENGTEVHLVGKSRASGAFESWVCLAYDAPGLAAYDTRQTNTWLLPETDACDAHTRRLAARACAEDGLFDPDTDGVRLMRGQMRAYPGKVGGFCQATIVSDDGITTRVLERWPEQAELANVSTHEDPDQRRNSL